MKKKIPKFNPFKLRTLLDESLKDQSRRKVAQQFNINRNSINNWIGGKTKKGPNDESWDKIIHLLAQMNIFIRKADFYDDGEPTEYNHENLIENFVSDNDLDENSNIINDPIFVDLIEKLNNLEDLYRERCQRILDLHEIIEKKDEMIKEKNLLINDLLRTQDKTSSSNNKEDMKE